MRKDWEVLERHELLDCSPWFKVFREAVRLEDGQTVIPDFYQIDGPSYAMIFALTVDNKVALVEQYKHGPRRAILELPAGFIEPGESPIDGAERELREETGLEAPEWHSLGTFVHDGNWGCSRCHGFLAIGASQVAAPHSGDLQQQTIHYCDLDALRRFWLSEECMMVGTAAVIGLGLAHLAARSAG